jgi:hypothetical protein
MTDERIKELLELCEKATKILHYLCESHTPLRMCIPVQEDDYDVVLGSVITALPEALAELAAARELISQMSEGMECLDGCDRIAHDELCPVANPGGALAAARDEIARLKENSCT